MSTSPLPTVLDVLLANAAATPDKLAFEIEGEAETYAGLLERIRRMAGALSRYGLGPGERCAIALPTSLDSLIAVLASQWTGGAPVIVDDKLPAGMIVNRLRLVRPRVVIGSEELIASLRQADHALTCELLTPDRISGEAASATVFDHRAVITEPAYLQLTSGTTGEPKAAVVSHSALSHFLRMFRDQI